jgi:5-methylcytosine-specific restriction protein A
MEVPPTRLAAARTPNYRRTVLNRDAIRLDDGTPSKVGKCARCGEVYPLVCLEADHIEPIAFGGVNDPSNMQTLCQPCHKAKTASEFGRTR